MDNLQPSSSSTPSSTTSRLCEVCQGLFSGSWIPSRPAADGSTRENEATYLHHANLNDLEACASHRGGCPLCITLFDRLQLDTAKVGLHSLRKTPEEVSAEMRVKCEIVWGPATGRGKSQPEVEAPSVDLNFLLVSSNDEEIPLHSSELLPAQMVLPHLRVVHSTEPTFGGGSTASPETYEFIRQKLAVCDATHKACLAQTVSSLLQPYVPKRLIDVGSREDRTIRVVESPCHDESSSEGIRYITLSHSWGKAEMVTLSERFSDVLKKGAPLEMLPKTFREAIEVTRQLRIRYIWIDSLCIIQDSKSDWLEQAPQMQNIYKHAFLNISASSGVDSHSGLFRSRKAESIWPFHVELQIDGHAANFQGPLPGSYYCHDPRQWTQVEYSSLSLRAWVMQERILSPRICHFGRSQVFWQCRENEASETFPDVEPEWSSPSRSTLYSFYATPNAMSLRRVLDEGPNMDTGRLYREWDRFIETYSLCRLTVDGDVFMALEGIARELRDRTGDELVMGLWRSQLPATLCWVVSWAHNALRNPILAHQFHPVRPREWRAPSWSWAAVRLPVFRKTTRLKHSEMENLLEVVAIDNIEVQPGCFEPASLRVRGQIFSGELLPPPYEEVATPKGVSFGRLKLASSETQVLLSICLDDGETMALGSMNHTALLPVYKFRQLRGSESERYGWEVEGLLLARSGRVRGQYYRRGDFAMAFLSHHTLQMLRDVRPEPWMDYESRCEDTNLCTISII